MMYENVYFLTNGYFGIGKSFASGMPDSFNASAEISSNSKEMIAFVLNYVSISFAKAPISLLE